MTRRLSQYLVLQAFAYEIKLMKFRTLDYLGIQVTEFIGQGISIHTNISFAKNNWGSEWTKIKQAKLNNLIGSARFTT